jgi:hypothetical protein
MLVQVQGRNHSPQIGMQLRRINNLVLHDANLEFGKGEPHTQKNT